MIFRLLCIVAVILSGVARAQTTPLSDLEALRYIASQPDLIAAFGADAAKGRSHYETWGIKEGRKITFEPLNYTASHPDLMAAFGIDEIKAVTHYIQWGFKEGRKVTFTRLHALRYIASHADLIAVFGADAQKGLRHYIQFGFVEKRAISFSELDALRYVASYGDLILGLGAGVESAVVHYIEVGFREGRTIRFDPQRYLQAPSNADLLNAFGTDYLAATLHYINFGFKEGRTKSADSKPPEFQGSVSSVTFGDQRVGGSATRVLTVRNSGEESLLFESVSITGGTSKEFSVASRCGSLLSPGSSCVVNIVFSPLDRGAETAVLSIRHNAAGRITNLPISAKGVAPVLVASTLNVDFGSRPVNSPSEQVKIVFKNEGDASLNLDGSFYLDGGSLHFPVYSNCMFTSIPVNGSCEITAQFLPKRAGNLSVKVSWYHDAENSPAILQLKGSASGPAIEFGSNSLAFGSQPLNSTSDQKNLVVSNLGDAPLSINAIEIRGVASADYKQTNDCKTVAINDRCVIKVSFNPSQLGSKAATLNILHNSPANASSNISLSGTGVNVAPVIGASPRSLVFPSQGVGVASAPQAIKISNRGSSEMTIKAISITGDDSGDFSHTTTCGPTLAVGVSCELRVIFKPIRAGSRSASVSVSHNAAGGTEVVPLSGTGGLASVNNFICESTLSEASVESSTVSSDLDIRDTDDRLGFTVRIPSWRQSDFNGGAILRLEAVDSPSLRIEANANCPIVNLVDPTKFKGRAGICNIDISSILTAPSGSRFRLSLLRRSANASGSTSLVIQYSTLISLGRASLRPPILVGDVSRGRVNLTWRPVDGATSYRVFRINGGTAELIADRITALSVSLDAPDGIARSYALRAVNDTHDSGLSNSVSLTPGLSPLSRVVINDLQLVQTVAGRPDDPVPLIASKAGIVRAYFSVNGNEDGRGGIVRLSRAGTGNFIDISGPILNKPDSGRQATSCVATFDLRDAAAAWFTPGDVNLTVQVDYGDRIVAGSPTLKLLTKSFYFVPQKPIQIMLFPISTATYGSPTDTEMSEFKAELGALLDSMYPNASIYIETAERPFSSGLALSPPDFDAWVNVLDRLNTLRNAELSGKKCDRFYYGVFKSAGPSIYTKNYPGGLGGIAFLPDKSTLGGCPPLTGIGTLHDSVTFDNALIAAHEIGHNHGLLHVAATGAISDFCGAPSGVDKFFPHLRGEIGQIGYDAFNHRVLDPVLHTDIMTYCQRYWISDYHFKKIRQFQEELFDNQSIVSSSSVDKALSDGEPLEVLMIRGIADLAEGRWSVTSLLNVVGAASSADTSADYEAEIVFGSGASRTYPVVLHKLDHSAKSIFEVRVADKGGLKKIFVKGKSGKSVLEWTLGAPEYGSAWEAKQQGEALARRVSEGLWEVQPWDGGDRLVIRVRAEQRSFVGNDDGSQALVVPASVGDSLEIFGTQNGTRVSISLSDDAEASPNNSEPMQNQERIGTKNEPISRRGITSADGSTRLGHLDFRAQVRKPPILAKKEARVPDESVARDVDPLSGGVYQLHRWKDKIGKREQAWRIDFRGGPEALFGSKNLPSTTEVQWRGPAGWSTALPTNGWVRVCSDRVWVAQDGYQTLLHSADKGLTDVRTFQVPLGEVSEAALVTDLRCEGDAGVRLEGYVFTVDAEQPQLFPSNNGVRRFALILNRRGEVSWRDIRSARFDLNDLCSAPADEQQMFCNEANKAVGW